MKSTILKNILAISLLGIAFSVDATEPTSPVKTPTTQTQTASAVNLYAANNNKNIITTLPASTHFIKIYQKGDWIKVGNPEDGAVGWINQKEYKKALDAFYQPNVQEIVVSQTLNDKGKPEIKIVAYKNGKAVSEKEAKALYNNIRKQQQQQEEYWKEFNKSMIKWQNMMMQDLFNNPFFTQTPIPRVSVTTEKDSKE